MGQVVDLLVLNFLFVFLFKALKFVIIEGLLLLSRVLLPILVRTVHLGWSSALGVSDSCGWRNMGRLIRVGAAAKLRLNTVTGSQYGSRSCRGATSRGIVRRGKVIVLGASGR